MTSHVAPAVFAELCENYGAMACRYVLRSFSTAFWPYLSCSGPDSLLHPHVVELMVQLQPLIQGAGH
jgi:hypothetical protein